MKCGKYIGNDDVYCSDCAPKQAPAAAPVVEERKPEPVIVHEPVAQPTYTTAEPVKPKREGRVMDGFGPALTSHILGSFAYTFAYMAYIYATMGDVLWNVMEMPTNIFSALCIIFSILAIGFAIPTLILGIKSIKFFRAAVLNKRVKPIPALVLGIYSTAMCGLTLILISFAFLMMLAGL